MELKCIKDLVMKLVVVVGKLYKVIGIDEKEIEI